MSSGPPTKAPFKTCGFGPGLLKSSQVQDAGRLGQELYNRKQILLVRMYPFYRLCSALKILEFYDEV